MAIGISQPIHREGGFAIDDSLLLTKAQMRDMPDNMMPSMYFCICLEDGKLYLYDKSATPDAETGKYSLYSNESVSPFVELDALPEANEETYNLYKGMLVFVPSSEPTADNKFDEYKIHQDTSTTPTTYYWDKVGDIKVEVDLSEYLKYTDVLSELLDSDKPVSASAIIAALNKKQDKLLQGDGISINSTTSEISVDAAQESDFTDEDIAAMADVSEQDEFFKLLGDYTQELPIAGDEDYFNLITGLSPEFAEYLEKFQNDKIASPKRAILQGEGKTITFTDFTRIDDIADVYFRSADTAGGCYLEIVFSEYGASVSIYSLVEEAPEWVDKTITLTSTFEY